MTADSLSSWATVVVMIPFGVLLTMTIFGLDTGLVKPRSGRLFRVRFCEDSDGRGELAQPDGHIWEDRRPRRDAIFPSGAQEI